MCFSFLNKKISFIFNYVSADACGSQRLQIPLELELKIVVSYLTWVLGMNLGFLQEQQVLSHLSSPHF